MTDFRVRKVVRGFVIDSTPPHTQTIATTPEEVLATVKQLLSIQTDELEMEKKPDGFGLCRKCKYTSTSIGQYPCSDGCYPRGHKHWTPKAAKPAMPAFKVGDRVRSAYDAQRVGTVVEVDMRSTWPYLVNWPGSSSNCKAEALELADEKPEKRFCVGESAGLVFRTIEDARARAEELAKAHPERPYAVCEALETCTAIEKKTVEVEWLK